LPPPPPLAPPEGYAGYAPTNWATGMRRVSGLSKAILILLIVYAIGQAITTAMTPTAVDAAVEYLDTRDEDAFNDDLVGFTAGSWLTGAAQIALIVLSVIWLYRIVANHRGLGRQTTWGPAWAIAGWVLPPQLYIIPLLVLRESWKAAAPEVPPGSPDWKRQGEPALVWVWFLVYSITPIILLGLGANQFRSMGTDREDFAEYFRDQENLIIAGGIVSILGAIAWALVVRELSRRHSQLTGEATLR
jgi:hypothetical protein